MKRTVCDGLLDVCVIRDIGVVTFLRYLPRVLSGTHVSLPPVSVFQTEELTVAAERAPVVHLDGEVRQPEAPSITAKIEPAALPALCA